MDPIFLTLDEVLEIHRDQIARHGGSEGIRDVGLLNSAIAMPTATFGSQFLHSDVYEMAAAYLFHLVQNHPFIDGNKRVGAAAANVFLFMNEILFAPRRGQIHGFSPRGSDRRSEESSDRGISPSEQQAA